MAISVDNPSGDHATADEREVHTFDVLTFAYENCSASRTGIGLDERWSNGHYFVASRRHVSDAIVSILIRDRPAANNFA